MRPFRPALAALAALVLSGSARADVLPQGKVLVPTCHKLDASNAGDYILLGYTLPGINAQPVLAGDKPPPNDYQPASTTDCLPHGYRSDYGVIAVLKSEWADKTSVSLSDAGAVIPTYERSFEDEGTPIKARTKTWAVAGVKDGKVVLYLAQFATEYKDKAPVVVTHPKPAGF